MRPHPQSQSPLNNSKVSVPESVLVLAFIFTLEKGKHRYNLSLQGCTLLDHHWPSPPPTPVPFCCYQRQRQKGRTVTCAQNTRRCKWFPHVKDENIFQDTREGTTLTRATPHSAAHNFVCKPSLPVTILRTRVLTDTTHTPWNREWTKHLSSDFYDFQLNFLSCWNMDHLLHHAYFCIINLLACWNHSWKPFILGLQQ